MQILKVLNNSLVLGIDDNGEQVILMGKGIGYQKSIGYTFSEEDIEKIFILKDKEISRNIIRLAKEINAIFFEIANTVISYAKEECHLELMDHIYLSLTDHLSFAYKRYNDNITFFNFYTAEMRKFNPVEYKIGLYALQVIKDELGVEIPEDEAGNIAFHFINAQYNHPYNERNQKINLITNTILGMVKYRLKLVYNEDSIYYSRYLTHLRFFAQRFVSGKQLDDGDEYKAVYKSLYKKCKEEIECVESIRQFLKKKYNCDITEQEAMFLTMHISRIRGDSNQLGL